METKPEAKSDIRRQMRALRKAVSADERRRQSMAVCEKLAADDAVAACAEIAGGRAAVAVYLASPDEIDLSPFIREMLRRGVKVAAPRWNGETYELAKLAGLGEGDLRRGPMNILEPAQPDVVPPSQVAVWIVPGLAFAPDGRRIGYGGGWYDRLLSGASAQSVKIGVAYDFQVVPDIPLERHDVPLDRVIA